jgi:hypothetical protein
LLLVCVAVTRYTGFYFSRRIASDFDSILLPGEKHHAPNLSEPKRCPHVQSGKHGFHRHNLRLKPGDEITEKGMHFL